MSTSSTRRNPSIPHGVEVVHLLVGLLAGCGGRGAGAAAAAAGSRTQSAAAEPLLLFTDASLFARFDARLELRNHQPAKGPRVIEPTEAWETQAVFAYNHVVAREKQIGGVQGAHLNPLGLVLNPLGLFLRTSIPFILHILSAFLPA